MKLYSMGVKEEKQGIRERIWRLMVEENVAIFPFGRERIPNFKNAEKAAESLRTLQVYKDAKVIKINPDSPQRKVRENALEDGKTVYMPTPKLREGFLELDPARIPKDKFRAASSIRGAFRFGRNVALEKIRKVDLIVAGCVAVNRDGAKVGKGGGYSDREYAIMKELFGCNFPVATTVHPLQIIEEKIPMEKNDVPLDFIATEKGVIETKTIYRKPEGICWDLVSKDDLEKIPLLRELKTKARPV